jgi:hypothetical protein
VDPQSLDSFQDGKRESILNFGLAILDCGLWPAFPGAILRQGADHLLLIPDTPAALQQIGCPWPVGCLQ